MILTEAPLVAKQRGPGVSSCWKKRGSQTAIAESKDSDHSEPDFKDCSSRSLSLKDIFSQRLSFILISETP
jgi:hypothetical protein